MRARTLLRDTDQEAFAEAINLPGRPGHALSELGTHSNLKVQWRCAQCQHCWVASPAARSRGGGCPRCAVGVRAASRTRPPKGKSLADLFPEIAAEFVRNESRPESTPDQLRAGSQQQCVWRCARRGHEWASTVANRTGGRGCPSCANDRRAEALRSVGSGASAAYRAPGLAAQLVANLTSPGVGLQARRPASVDRCLWRCAVCTHEWEATIANRVTKGSGCPKCAVRMNAEVRRASRSGQSLADVHPHLVGQLVVNETHPGRMASQMPAKTNDQCWWRCSRGHEWTTTVAARAAGSGCRRCGGFGRSRFELEVAELLATGCNTEVEADVDVLASGRRWRIDLYLPAIGVYIDLDPAQWHQDHARDARKAAALSNLDYVRVRPPGLGELEGQICLVTGNDDGSDPLVWAAALGGLLAKRALPWREPALDAVAQALARAARSWIDIGVDGPRPSALDAAPHLAEEFLDNLTRPGIGLEWLTPYASDRVRWKCGICDWVWDAVVSSRAGAQSGCPKCTSKRLGQEGSLARPGQSLTARRPDLAAEFVSCIRHPDRTAAQLKPSSNFPCLWRCRTCKHEWTASPGGRLRGGGCPACARERIRRSRTIAPAEESLLALNPNLAQEFVSCLDEPGRTTADLLPKSNKACHWRCATCGHEWVAQVATRTAGGGCPPCGRIRTAQARASAPPGGSLEDLFPQLALEAVENLDRPERDPNALRPGSHNRCRWHCAVCGHSWATSVKNRAIHGTRCPACVHAGRISPSAGTKRR